MARQQGKQQQNPGTDREQQVERFLIWILATAVVGLFAILILGLGRPEGSQVTFFGTATLAACAALAAGAALGLLFGLPWRSDQVIVAAPPAQPIGQTAQGAAAGQQAPVAQGQGSWYKDNTSLEQIAQWLTTSIVALTLVNFDGWVMRFDRAATNVTCAMYEVSPVKDAASAQATSPAPANPIATSPGLRTANLVTQDSRATPAVRQTTSSVPPTNAGAARSNSECKSVNPAPGGIVLALYAILGLLGGYLWARRYLMRELNLAQTDALRARQIVEQKAFNRASASGLVQGKDKEELPTDRLKLAESFGEAAGLDGQPMVTPGNTPNDPWKGQFGGQPFNDKVLLSATVTDFVSRPGLYSVDLLLRPVDNAVRQTLANKPALIYLHPTFRDPIRIVRFDLTGQIEVPLVAYGAFTVGVQLWDGSEVELDLSQLAEAPADFKLR